MRDDPRDPLPQPDLATAPAPDQAPSDAAPRPASLLAGAVTLATLLFGLYRVFELRWVCDDAFISFRYARNLVAGHGLVYNVGERVEGYTNFLWTVLVACGMKLHVDPVHLTQVVGGLAFVATAMTLAFLSTRLGKEDKPPGRNLFLPAAALAFLVHYDSQVWATSGLEVMAITALTVAGFACSVLATRPRLHFFAGLLFVVAALTRPDALLFYFTALCYLVLEGGAGKRDFGAFVLPLLLVFVPYWLARYFYYGFLFPNTYYAKSGGLSNYAQGLAYLGLYVRSYFVLLLVPAAAVFLIWRRRARLFRHPEGLADRAAGLALGFCLVYTFYVVRVGGDFMFARFLIPVTPFAFLLFECGLRRLVNSWRVWAVVTVAVMAATVARRDLFATPHTLIEGIAQERSWYPRAWLQDREEFGRTLKRCLLGTRGRIAFAGTNAATAYYADLPYALEFEAGLTDTAIAHRPIQTRGRPGHEKRATLEDMLGRKIQILLHKALQDPTELDRVATIQIGYRTALIVMWDPELMRHLKHYQDVTFVDFPEYLDLHTPELLDLPDSTLAEVYRLFRKYYFDHNADSIRAAPFEARRAALRSNRL